MQKYILSILISIPFLVSAQQELGLHFMRHTYQSNMTNPAFFMQQKVAICLPSIYTNYGNSAFSQRSVVSKDSVIDLNEASNHVKAYNYLSASANVSPIAVGVRLNNLQFGLTTGVRAFSYLGYNKNMFKLLTQGNKDFIDQTVSIAPDLQVNIFTEIGVSAAYRLLDEKLSIGIRGKYLMGVADISTSTTNRKLDIYTDPDIYQLHLTTNYDLNTSLMGLDLTDSTSGNFKPHFSGKNNGVAFDIGAEYKISDKLSVSASLIDLGGITWKANTNSYTSKGTYVYEGVDAGALVLKDSAINFDAVIDTMKKALHFEKNDQSTYKTPLHSQFYLSASYKPIAFLRVGGLFYGQFIYGKLNPALALSGNIEVKKWFNAGVVMAYRNKHLMPPGINIALGSGAVQAYFATDNIVGVFMPFRTRDYNVRTGLNFLIGYKEQ